MISSRVTSFVFAGLLWPALLSAQLPTLGAPQSGSDRATGANNEWFLAGAQLGYRFDGNSDFEDDLITSGRVVLTAYKFPKQSPAVGLPIIGNLSKLAPGIAKDSVSSLVQRIVSTAEGLNVGLYPYWEFMPRGTGGWIRGTMFGSAVYKVNAGRDRTDSSAVTLNQGRFSVGGGFDLFVAEGDLPLSLSVEGITTVFSGNAFRRITGEESANSIVSLELTGVAPLGRSIGLLGQFTTASQGGNYFRVGLLYAVSKNKNDTPATTNLPAASVSDANGVLITGLVSKGGAPQASMRVNVVAQTGGSLTTNGTNKTCTGGTSLAPVRVETGANGRFEASIPTGTTAGKVCVIAAPEDANTVVSAVETTSAPKTDGKYPTAALPDIVIP